MVHYPNITKAELRDRIHISDDALEHLLTDGVVRPAGAPCNPRTFAADDVMIAAIAAELHRYDISTGVLIKLTSRLYDGVSLARPLGLKPVDIAEAREAVELRLDRLEHESDGQFDAYDGVSTDPAAAPPPFKLKPGSSIVEAIADFDPLQLVVFDLYLGLVDPRYLESDPPLVFWHIAPIPGSDNYRLSYHVGAEVPDVFSSGPSWITICITSLARRVWLGD